jgi:hypothetical protein
VRRPISSIARIALLSNFSIALKAWLVIVFSFFH